MASQQTRLYQLPSYLHPFPVWQALFSRMYNRPSEESSASAFYQAIFQYYFRAENGYAVSCEQPPKDGDRQRLDIVCHTYDPHAEQHLSLLALVEMKRVSEATTGTTAPKKKQTEALQQTLQYAIKAMEEHRQDFVLTLSVTGPVIFFGYCPAGQRTLQAFFHDNPTWIDVNDPPGLLLQFINGMKDLNNIENYRWAYPPNTGPSQ